MFAGISPLGWIAMSSAIIAAGVVFFLSLRKGRPVKLAYQWDGRVIAGKEKEELHADILAAMREANSPYVCCSEIILWNAGEQTIRGSDIDPAEPLRIISTLQGSRILRIVRRSATSDAIAFTVAQDADHPNVAFCDFDFLAPSEGVRLQIYQPGVVHGVNLMGKVRGQKDNILNLGRVPIGDASNRKTSWMLRQSPWMCALFALLVIVAIPAVLLLKIARHGHDPDFQLMTLGDGMRFAYWVLLGLFQMRITMAQYRARFGRYPRSLVEN